MPNPGGTTAVGVVLIATWWLAGCVGFDSYGASFDYPSAPAVPPRASLVASDTGADDDDPIRSRIQVIEGGNRQGDDLVDRYRRIYTPADGWKIGRHQGWQEFCLVNREEDGYTQVLDVSAYDGSRVPTGSDRHLVVFSRIEQPPARACGFADAWVSTDLLR